MRHSPNCERILRSFLCLVGFAWLSVAGSIVAQQPQENRSPSPALELGPKVSQETIAAIGVRDLRAFGAEYRKSAAFAFFSHPKLQAIASTQKQMRVGSLLNIEPWFGVHWSEIANLEADLALLAVETGPRETSWFFTLAFLDQNAAKAFEDQWIASRGGSVAFTQALDSAQRQWRHAKQDKRFAISTSDMMVQIAPLALIQGSTAKPRPTASFGVNGLLQWIRETELSNSGRLYFWANPSKAVEAAYRRYLDELAASGTKRKLETSNEDRILLENDSFRALKEIQGSVSSPSSKSPSWLIDYRGSLDSPLKIGLKILDFSQGSLVPLPPLLKPVSTSWSLSLVEIQPWFEGVTYWLDQTTDPEYPGAFSDILDSIKSDPDGAKIDIKKELIHRCGPEIFSAVAEAEKWRKKDGSSPKVFALRASKRSEIEDVLKRYFEGDEDVIQGSKNGFSYWYVEGEPLLFSAEDSSTETIHLVAIDDQYLYLSTDDSWFLKQIESKSPAASNGLSVLQNHIESGDVKSGSMFSQTAYQQSIREGWKSLPHDYSKSALSSNLLGYAITELLLGGKDSKAIVAKSPLPQWSEVQKFFGVASAYAKRDKNSITGKHWFDSMDE